MLTTTMHRMTKPTEQVNIRLPHETKARLAEEAARQHRTLSGLIIAILKDWLAQQPKK